VLNGVFRIAPPIPVIIKKKGYSAGRYSNTMAQMTLT
jgi:hypothetical protein